MDYNKYLLRYSFFKWRKLRLDYSSFTCSVQTPGTVHLGQTVKNPAGSTKHSAMSDRDCGKLLDGESARVELKWMRIITSSFIKKIALYVCLLQTPWRTSPLHIKGILQLLYLTARGGVFVCMCVHVCVCLIAVIHQVWRKFICSAVLYNPLDMATNWISVWCRLSSHHERHMGVKMVDTRTEADRALDGVRHISHWLEVQ